MIITATAEFHVIVLDASHSFLMISQGVLRVVKRAKVLIIIYLDFI